ncbi:MAG: NHLP bacteriocin export ABC transporter permease/ATPase subunit [Firmicutes bacterium]|nr:NHLP bacteriocin export ABC transporter permease/ATPase subunit [Bacillota bacterium]MCL5064268.1 NHLP bacteriocin export ABC transporter permease/ATPase subunit [Bacillota bacterium]
MAGVDWDALVGGQKPGKKSVSRQMTDILFLSDVERNLVHRVLQQGRMTAERLAESPDTPELDELQTLLDQLVEGGYLRTIPGEGDVVEYVSQLNSRPGRHLSSQIWQVLYEQIADVFDSEGESLAIEGNHPLDLSDGESIWLVRSGAINIFAVQFVDGEPSGRRRFMFSASVGEALFGMERKALPLGLIALGTPGTKVSRLPSTRLLELVDDSRYRSQIAGVLDTWIRNLEPEGTRMPPQDFQELALGEPITLNAEEIGRAPDGAVSWLKVESGAATLSAFAQALGVGTCTPLTDRAFVTVSGPATVKMISSEQWLAETGDWDDLMAYHRRVLDALGVERSQDDQSELVRLAGRAAGDERVVAHAVNELGSLLVPPAAALLTAREGEDGWAAAFRIVAASERLDVTPNATLDQDLRDPWERIEVLARQSHLRTRSVALRGPWWNDDIGSVLGSRLDDASPVAIISEEGGGVWVVDPVAGTRERLTAALAQTLSRDAVALVRPFGAKAVKPLELVRFGALGLKRDFGMVLTMSLVSGLLALLTPVFTGKIFGQIIPGAARGELWEVVIALTGAAVVTAMFQITRGIALVRVENHMDGAVESAVWDRVLDLPVPFFSRYTAGDLVMRAMGINSIRQVLTGAVLSSMLSGIFSIFSFALLFYYSASLAIAATLLALVLVTIIIYADLRLVRLQRTLLNLQGRLSGMVLQFVTGVAKLRVAGAEARAFSRWAERYREQQAITIQARQISNTLSSVMAMFTVVSSLVLFWVVSRLGPGGISVGAFLAFNAAYGQFVGSLLGISSAVMGAVQVVPLYERAQPILTTYPEIDRAKKEPGDLTGEIEISHVSFQYDADGPWILNDVSLHARPGEFIALVGSSGSGKSTIMRMLLNFAQPASGAIYFDGEDLQSLDPRAVRKRMGVVLQNGQLIQGDIFSNIVGASSNLTLENAWEAARMVGLDEDIERMPMGMQTYLSVGGGTLSGGQRQRILIARAIVNKPRILLFDEATSALDNRTQAIISKSIEQLRATRIVIAHRLSTIINADRIYVVDKGRIVQSGMYEELANVEGLFQDLMKRQLA